MGGRQHMSPSGRKSLPLRRSMLSYRSPKYFKWSEAPITFDRSDHPDNIPHPGRYPLVLDPIVRTVKLNRVLIDGGSGLNILFTKTLDDIKIPRSELNRSSSPFHGQLPGTLVIPLRQITLPVT